MSLPFITMSACFKKVICCHLFIFFRVIDGLETLDDLEKLPVNEKTYRPLTEVRIKNVTIHANPIADQSG